MSTHGLILPPALTSLPSDPAHLIYMVATSIFGTIGTILFMYILQRKPPNLSVIIRFSEVGVIFLIQICAGMKGFYYSDLFGFALIATATAHAVIELLFYGE